MNSVKCQLVVLLFVFSVCSCKNNNYRIDVSKIDMDVEIMRFEKELFDTDPSSLIADINAVKDKYGDFLQFFGYVINCGDIHTDEFNECLLRFCTDRQNNEVYADVMRVFPDVGMLEKDIENAFKHYLYYFPDKVLPDVYTCITGFNNSIIIGDSVIGISLDKYLGRDSEYYKRLGFYKYMSVRMNPYNIVPDCIYSMAVTDWDIEYMDYDNRNVLTEMIHEGKIRYFMKCMLPEVNDTLIFGFTGDQMRFCRNNEGRMWQSLVEQDLLFKTDVFILRKLLGEAPFTSYFTGESPGRATVWVGFRIVEAFMNANKNLSLAELMQETDCQKILEQARYSPF